MKYEDLVRLAANTTLIDSNMLRAFGEQPRALGVQLSRWVKAGRLVQLRRGAYLLPEHLRRRPAPVEHLANLLVRPSYVSLERALSIHGLIPEAVPLVQSVTTGRPLQLDTAVAVFSFRHVRGSWFHGYREIPVGGGRALVATPEKALLDLVYLSSGEFTVHRIEALRLQSLDRLNLSGLSRLAADSGSPRLQRAARTLAEFVTREQEETVAL